ncbi:MAG: head GIN domain-containing protein [Catalinimonas sp.]
MKTIFSFAGALALLFVFSACEHAGIRCVRGEGAFVTESYALDDFDGVSLALDAQVFINIGPDYLVQVRAQENVLDELELRVRGDELSIGSDRCLRGSPDVEIFVTMPEVELLSVSGSGTIVVDDRFATPDLRLGLSGSGRIAATTDAGRIVSNISGSGELDLSGTADEHEVDISGSGKVRAFDLVTERTEARISGSGRAEVNVSEQLIANISGSGEVVYEGTPEVISDVSGSGKVRRR